MHGLMQTVITGWQKQGTVALCPSLLLMIILCNVNHLTKPKSMDHRPPNLWFLDEDINHQLKGYSKVLQHMEKQEYSKGQVLLLDHVILAKRAVLCSAQLQWSKTIHYHYCAAVCEYYAIFHYMAIENEINAHWVFKEYWTNHSTKQHY